MRELAVAAPRLQTLNAQGYDSTLPLQPLLLARVGDVGC